MVRRDLKESLLPPLWVLSVAAAALLLWLLVQLKEILVLLTVAFAIAYVIEPILRRAERFRIRRPWGVLGLLLLLILVVVLVGGTAMTTLLREYRELANNLPRYVQTAGEKMGPLLEDYHDLLPLETMLQSPGELLKSAADSGVLKELGSALSQALLQGYSVTLTLVNLALLPFIVFYLATGFPQLKPAFLKLFRMSRRPEVEALLMEIDTYVSAFVRGQLMVASILFLLYALGLGIIGVELWLVLALIAGFGNLVPYLGTLIGILLASIMALVSFGTFGGVLAVWGVFAVVQFLEGTFITPRVLGDKVGVSPLIIILAIVAGGKLFGLLGIFLAVPAAAVIKVLVRRLRGWVLIRS